MQELLQWRIRQWSIRSVWIFDSDYAQVILPTAIYKSQPANQS